MARQSTKFDGFTHAERVKGRLDTSKLRPMVTRGSSLPLLLSVALNCRAFPTLPMVQRGLMLAHRVPLLLLPDESTVAGPVPSLNAQYPMSPDVGGSPAAEVVNVKF